VAVLVLVSAAGLAQAQPYAYVANLGSDDVTVIDTTSNAVVATIAVGSDPDAVAVSADGTRVYVSNFLSNAVSVIDAGQQAVIATVRVGRGPVGLAVSPDGTRLVVTNREDGSVSVVGTRTNQVLVTIPVGVGPDAVAITADGGRAYVTNSFSKEPGIVSVVDLGALREVERVSVQRNPNRVAIAPDGRTAYITNFRSWNVSLLATADTRVVDTFRVSGKPTGIAVNPNGAFAYVVGKHGDFNVFDIGLHTVTNGLQIPGRTDGIGITRTGATGYVANFDADTVTVLDLIDPAIVGTVPVGDQPFAVAINCVGRGCTDPPFTPIPTATPTPVPTQPPTATFPPTPTPDVTPAILSMNRVSGRAGEQITLTATLHANGWQVAGTQNDLHFEPDLIDATSLRCRRNPAIDKEATVFSSEISGVDVHLRALVLSLENTNSILDGAVLYACTVRLAVNALPGAYVVGIDNLGASTPDGEAIPTTGVEGHIDVILSAHSRAVSAPNEPEPLRLCSRGENIGMPCRVESDDCGLGLCTIAQGVCDGGDDDGLLCDCPGGRCASTGAATVCVGGGSEGISCDTDAICAGGHQCVGTHQLCASGATSRGMPCLRNAHCVDGQCDSAYGFCSDGDFSGYGCVANSDCPRGQCLIPGFPDAPARTPPEPEGSHGSNGCAIATTASGSGSLIAFGLVTLLVARRRR
jgi:YVTN family beta-propeller protein